MEQFTEWVENELKKRDWTLSDLAKRANLHPGTISNVLTKTRKVGPDVCLAIARALNYSPEVVFRHAGLLPPAPDPDPIIDELVNLFQQLGEIEQKLALRALRAWAEGEEDKKNHK